MISRKFRLTRPRFLIAKRLGKSRDYPDFSAVFYPHNGYSRFSVVISSKLAKKAVIRNRLRRNIYDQLSTLNSQFSTDMIIYPKSAMLNFSYEEIGTSLNTYLSKISA
jgi:ribonuclease P protein component